MDNGSATAAGTVAVSFRDVGHRWQHGTHPQSELVSASKSLPNVPRAFRVPGAVGHKV